MDGADPGSKQSNVYMVFLPVSGIFAVHPRRSGARTHQLQGESIEVDAQDSNIYMVLRLASDIWAARTALHRTQAVCDVASRAPQVEGQRMRCFVNTKVSSRSIKLSDGERWRSCGRIAGALRARLAAHLRVAVRQKMATAVPS